MSDPARKGGRPRTWESAAAKHRAYRQRQAARTQALEQFLLAVLNARLEDPELQAQVNAATDDVAVLEALTQYYHARHWQRPVRQG